MPEQHITCPKCGNKIPLTEAFTHDIEEKLRAEFQQDIRKKDAERATALDAQQRAFETQRAQDRARFEQQAKKQAEESLGVELKDLKNRLEESAKQLDTARRQELELRKRQRELEEREQNLKLEVERTLASERTKIWDDAGRKAAEEQHLKMAEKEKLVSDLRRQIDELQRRSELTSQQAQGEALEVELEALLARQFRTDVIEPVAKGVRGADLIQRVHDESGRPCGSIIWESKRTKAWSDGWIQKLKDDQRAAKAEIAVIVTTVLPKELNRFGFYEGIWVADFPSVMGLATALRANLTEVTRASAALEGKNEKMELIYSYLSGTAFKQRVEAIVESFAAMKIDLDAEKRSMEKIWAKREAQIERVIRNTAGMYGELQGIIGSALPEVKMLELPGNDRDGE
ncbi:MAG TPA: DUF2130 domain-containing protein [Bacteroidota bacterium]|jgi:hypothetical protein